MNLFGVCRRNACRTYSHFQPQRNVSKKNPEFFQAVCSVFSWFFENWMGVGQASVTGASQGGRGSKNQKNCVPYNAWAARRASRGWTARRLGRVVPSPRLKKLISHLCYIWNFPILSTCFPFNFWIGNNTYGSLILTLSNGPLAT